MKDKICEILKILGIDSVLENEIESPQLTTYCFNLKDSRMISQVNQKNLEIISDYIKKQVEMRKGGKYSFSLCIPKDIPDTVKFEAMMQPKNKQNAITVKVGIDTSGNEIAIDFNKVNHILVAGTTGSGKSVFVNTLLCGLIKSTPRNAYDLKLIDPKRVSFNMYKKLQNVELITEMEEASSLLDNMIDLMEQRYKYMEDEGETDKSIFKPVFVVVDELAELMLVDRGGCEKQLIRLLQKARQANIHIILATQRPTTDVISGLIKAQCDTRICLKMASYKDSMTVIDKGIGQRLLGHGDGYIKFPYELEERRFQTAFIADNLAARLINKIARTKNAGTLNKKQLVINNAIKENNADVDCEISIANSKIRNMILDCVRSMKEWNISIPNKIYWREQRSKEWLGLTRKESSTIILNENLYKVNDIAIELTIYHELAHLAAKSMSHNGDWREIVDKIEDNIGFHFNETIMVDPDIVK